MSGVYALMDQRLVRVGESPVEPEGSPPARRCPISEPAPFFRSLAFLLRSGYPLSRGLSLLEEGMEKPAERTVCAQLSTALSHGKSLSEAFRESAFPNELVCALEAGEMAGRVEEAMEWYAEFHEANTAIGREIRQALLNPFLTLAGALLFALVLPPLVLRDQLLMLAENGAPLPWLSQALLTFSNVMASPAVLVLPLLGWLAVWSLRRLLRTASGQRRVERLLLRVPVLGEAVRRASAARCLALMSMILKSGASPTAALLIGGKGSGSRLLKDRLQISVHSLIGGVSFTESLLKTRWFLRSSISLMQSGEWCGDTSEMMAMAARIEEDKLRDALRRVAALIPPVALLLTGALVCLMVMAVLGPSATWLATL